MRRLLISNLRITSQNEAPSPLSNLSPHLMESRIFLDQVIDDDLGKSGASIDQRLGFQFLIAEVGLGRAGLVISLDASRLARNNSDWYHLLDLRSMFGALIADSKRLYDSRL